MLKMNKCKICGCRNYKSINNGKIRAGTNMKMTSEVFDVIQCEECKLASLSPIPKINYSSSEYRELYNDTSDIKDYISMYDQEQTPRISKILRGGAARMLHLVQTLFLNPVLVKLINF